MKTKEHRPTKQERELLEQVERLQRDEAMNNAEYGRYARALDGLMRDILNFLGDELNMPTSINSARLIAAIGRASRIIQDRR